MYKEVQELCMVKRKNNQSQVFLKESIQVSENKNPKPSDSVRMTVVTKHAALQKEVEAQQQVLNLPLAT